MPPVSTIARLIKLDSQGNKLWDKTYGEESIDGAYSIIETTDDGYAVAGIRYFFGKTRWEVWVIKLNDRSDIVWDKNLRWK